MSGPPSDTSAPADAAAQGLSQAADAAGDVLRGLFGGLPWELSPDAIVDAVSTLAVHTPDAVGVIG